MPRVGHIEKTVWRIEGFRIKIMRNGIDVRSDKVLPRQYIAGKMSKNAFTVNEWIYKFQCQFPGFDVKVLYADGTAARGNTLLSTVRETYGYGSTLF